MPAQVKPKNNYTAKPSLAAITPYQMYVMQVRGTVENIRNQAQGLDYLPPQFGGLTGQRQTLAERVVLQNIDFKVV